MNDKANTDLCIVIPTFNRKEPLSLLLSQLSEQKPDIGHKIVAVVDGSTDGTLEVLSTRFPQVHVIRGDGNWWFTKSVNEGCRYAVNTLNAQLVLIINDDVQVPENYLHNITASYRQCDPNSIVGSSSYSSSTPRVITFSGFRERNRLLLKYYKYVKSFTYLEPGTLKGVAESVTLPTRGMLVPSFVLKNCGYFDEKNFPQYESDYDFALRARKKGTKVFVSYDAYVFENMQLTSSGNPRLVKKFSDYLRNIFFNRYSSDYFFNRMRVCWRHGIKVLFPFYFGVAIAAIPYIYLKYKFFLHKKLDGKN